MCTYVLRKGEFLQYTKLRLRLLMGVLPYIVVVDELLIFTQNHRRKATK